MIGGRRPLKGRKPADRRVRVERPHSAFFRYAGPGQLVAKPAAHQPKTGVGRAGRAIRGVAIGRPLATEEEIGERLSKKKALAIFSSDAISSSAYATEEILRVLILAGTGAALLYSLPCRSRDLGAAGGRGHLVPTGLPGLPERRRSLLRVEGEPQRDGQPGRRRGAAHRLRDDRRGLDGIGDRPGRSRSSRRSTTSGSRSA